jgi:hypothetical protein
MINDVPLNVAPVTYVSVNPLKPLPSPKKVPPLIVFAVSPSKKIVAPDTVPPVNVPLPPPELKIDQSDNVFVQGGKFNLQYHTKGLSPDMYPLYHSEK